MSRLEKAAIDFHGLIWNNTGSTDDWPIQLKLDDEIHDKVVDAINELHDAILEIDPGLVPWPLVTGDESSN